MIRETYWKMYEYRVNNLMNNENSLCLRMFLRIYFSDPEVSWYNTRYNYRLKTHFLIRSTREKLVTRKKIIRNK